MAFGCFGCLGRLAEREFCRFSLCSSNLTFFSWTWSRTGGIRWWWWWWRWNDFPICCSCMFFRFLLTSTLHQDSLNLLNLYKYILCIVNKIKYIIGLSNPHTYILYTFKRYLVDTSSRFQVVYAVVYDFFAGWNYRLWVAQFQCRKFHQTN